MDKKIKKILNCRSASVALENIFRNIKQTENKNFSFKNMKTLYRLFRRGLVKNKSYRNDCAKAEPNWRGQRKFLGRGEEISFPLHQLQQKFLLTRQNGQQEDVVGEGDESVASKLVEDAVFLQLQIESLRDVLDSEERWKNVNKFLEDFCITNQALKVV